MRSINRASVRSAGRLAGSGLALALSVGLVLHLLHGGQHEAAELPPVLHWLRDSFLAVPAAFAAVAVASLLAPRILRRVGLDGDRRFQRLAWALLAALAYAAASIPGNLVHARLFAAEHHEGMTFLSHAVRDGSAVLGAALVLLLALAAVVGAPVEGRWPLLALLRDVRSRGFRPLVSGLLAGQSKLLAVRAAPLSISVALLAALVVVAVPRVENAKSAYSAGCAAFGGTKTVRADVVALDQPISFNRLGAENPDGMIYALRTDVVAKNPSQPLGPGNAALRPGKRPRPLVLRVGVGDCLLIHFENLLSTTPQGDQPAERRASIHVNGMQLADPDGAGPLQAIDSDGSFVGRNESSLVGPGESRDYLLFAEHENIYLLYSMGATTGAEGNGGSLSYGLFGAVDVEPFGSQWYRSQLSRAELDLATPAEEFTDGNGNGRWDPAYPAETRSDPTPGCESPMKLDAVSKECYADTNANGERDAGMAAEPTSDPIYACADGEKIQLIGGSPQCFTDTANPTENGVWDDAMPKETTSPPAPDGTCATGTLLDAATNLCFVDGNGNETLDLYPAELRTEPTATCVAGQEKQVVDGKVTCYTDTDGDGSWDAAVANEPLSAPTLACAAGESGPVTIGSVKQCFVDSANPNENGVPDGAKAAEPLDDTNGDGGWDVHRSTPGGQPLIDYDAIYPANGALLESLGIDPQLAGLPIIRMLDANGRIVHSDLTSIVTGPKENGYRLPKQAYPDSFWANKIANDDNERGAEPFREFTVVFQDEVFALQAFPDFFDDAKLEHTLHGVRDGFGINYGIAGAGSEVIANRLKVGPMWNCVDCKFEEFFLSSWTTGDPAMVVDRPANQTTAAGGPGSDSPTARATKALYPDDPSNVYHSYLGDRVKIRNVHAGPKEHHIFHLHAHQWQHTSNSEKSSYLDSQLIGPGAGFTYEIAYGGSGNRNKTFGDSIFHCHFYPHFAQGMWGLWRTHDTFESGTKLDGAGRPEEGSRALPDGEITAGTPIPAIVPLPARPMAPMSKAPSEVVPYDLNGNGVMDSGQLDVDGNGTADIDEGFSTATKLTLAAAAGASTLTVQSAAGMRGGQALLIGEGSTPEKRTIVSVAGNVVTLNAQLAQGHAVSEPVVRADNPGYPFFVPAVAGHRPPTAPLDVTQDGGLPRHIVVGGTAEQFQSRLDFNKTLKTATLAYVPEEGAAAEKAAMDYHSAWWHPTFTSDGTKVDGGTPLNSGGRPLRGFETNGLPPVAGAPFADPCRKDPGPNDQQVAPIGDPRGYKAAAFQLDLTLNKAGWHFPQQRMFALNEDVGPTINGARPAEPFVMRLGVNDCATYEATNLVPNTYQLDDFQVRTPTDVLGQHIHLVKFDVLSADGSANGFNYEDGTLSPEEVEERVHAAREANGCAADPGQPGRLDSGETPTEACPLARRHATFASTPEVGDLAWGARSTVQRWYADRLLNNAWDGGVGTVFTHDHFSPSTHQQVGLYATVLVEPEGSLWRDPETGVRLGAGARADGGPTSWRADIYWPDGDDRNANAHREYYLEIADFQHAYQKGAALAPKPRDNEAGAQIPSYDDFLNAISPSHRQEPPAGKESSLVFFPPWCPNGEATDTPRPCPEAISADDPGTYVVNYRNEPIGLRVFDPATKRQAAGAAGDLSLAFQSRTDRAVGPLNSQPAGVPALTKDVQPGDPYTPLLRAYQGDRVRLRLQVGATEEEHTFSMSGLKWLQGTLDPESGWRNSQSMGISEYFTAEAPIVPDLSTGRTVKTVDYLYMIGAATEDLWNGNWGLMRAYGERRTDLLALPNNNLPARGWRISNQEQFDRACPKKTDGVQTRIRRYDVTAVRAIDVLGPQGLVYNDRNGAQKLVDPTALLYVFSGDLVRNPLTRKPIGLKPGTPIEPIVLRAAAGECIKVSLENQLPATALSPAENKPGFNGLPPIVQKETVDVGSPFGPGYITFNANDLVPSSRVGLHPQLVSYDVRRDDGLEAGISTGRNTVAPGEQKLYTWYAGDLELKPDPEDPTDRRKLVATPVEYGAANLMPSDRIMGPSKGLVGALVIEPPGATWRTDPGSRTSATVTFPTPSGPMSTREFVTVLQEDVNLRYSGGCTPTAANLECAVPNISGEGPGFPEDPQDSGQKAINYGADPIWFRLGISPDTPFEDPVLRGSTEIHKAFSNTLVGGDPETPVFQASVATGAPRPARLRVVQPGGHSRGHVMTVHGHVWQAHPYVQTGAVPSDRLAWAFQADPTNLSGPALPGQNKASSWISAQESVSSTSHFDLQLPGVGGRFAAPGDYLFRDFASFGSYQGLWSILRVGQSPARAGADMYFARLGLTINVPAASGLLANDLDLDGDPFTVTDVDGKLPGQQVTTANGGKVTVAANGGFSYTPAFLFSGVDTFTYGVTGGSRATVSVVVRSALPVPVTDWVTVGVNSLVGAAAKVPVVANDTDPDGDETLSLVTDAATGDVSIARAAGATPKGVITGDSTLRGIVFTPVAPYTFGDDTFTYSVEDGTGNVASAAVRVTVVNADVGFVAVSNFQWDMPRLQWKISGTVSGPTTAKWPSKLELRIGGRLIGSIPLTAPPVTSDEPTSVDFSFTGRGSAFPRNCGEKGSVESKFGTAAGAKVANIQIKCLK